MNILIWVLDYFFKFPLLPVFKTKFFIEFGQRVSLKAKSFIEIKFVKRSNRKGVNRANDFIDFAILKFYILPEIQKITSC